MNKTYIFEDNSNIPNESNTNLITLLNNEGLEIKYIKCGSDSDIMQKREQWTDGANAFALAPGKIVGYDCNKHTIDELKKSGYNEITSDKYISNYKKYSRYKNLAIKKIDSKYRIIGESEEIQQVQEIIQKISATDARVLITGENGFVGSNLAESLKTKHNIIFFPKTICS